MTVYARGRHAYGFCDRCGFRYDLGELKFQMVNREKTGLKVCPDCMDIDHEQLRVGEVSTLDPQALHLPRPDQSQGESQALFGYNPVGNPADQMTGRVGQAHVN
jgi:hypothetical protein